MSFFDNLFDGLEKQFSEGEKLELPPSFAIPKPDWLYDFCVDIMGHEDMRPQPHYELCNLLEWAVGNCQFKEASQRAAMILLPRGCFKTTISVESLSTAVLTKNPNARILITSHKAKQANERVVASRNPFDRNEKFAEIYGADWKPEFREYKWTDAAYTVARRTKEFREPSVQGAAVGADVTGSHYDLIIADDIVNLDNCYTQESRDKVYDYLISLFPHLEPGGTLLIVGTRWHENDAYGRLIKLDDARVKSGKPERYRKLIRGCYDGPGGLFFPTVTTHEFLNELQASGMTGRIFAANYLNQTIADEDKIFKMDKLTEIEFEFYNTMGGQGVVKTANGQYPVNVTLAWDTAGVKSTSKSDYHGITVVGTDEMNRWWVMESLGLKGGPTEIVTRVSNLVDFYRPSVILVEAVGNYLHWAEALQRMLEPRGIPVPVQEISHGGIPKQERIVMLELPWNNRKMHFKPGLDTLKHQLDNFSMASLPTHDDEMDSLAMHIGHTVPAEDGFREEVQPLDNEWLRRKQRQQQQENNWRGRTRYRL